MTNKLRKKILDYYKFYYKDSLGVPNWETLTNNQLKEEDFESKRIGYLENLLSGFKGKKVLDVGCGTGGFVVASNLRGANTIGIEPDAKAVEICHLKKCNVIKSYAEKLPFNNNLFDIVHCLTVLEHVEDIEKSILEMVRVTKKGGIIYIKCPNYLSFYEGHYKLFWLPKFPKKIAKIYLKLRNRPVGFIDTINYVTPSFIEKILKKLKLEYKLIPHKIERHKGLLNSIIYCYQKIFNINQNIEIIIKV